MTSLLSWHFGTHAHRSDLPAFQCTDVRPKPREREWRKFTPGWWEYEVQSRVRALRPPYRTDSFLLVGYDDVGLAAVSFVQELAGPDVVEAELGAVATRLRNKGGGYADELIRETLDALTERALEQQVPEVLVVGHVYELNGPSQALCRRHGFVHTGAGAEGVQQWTKVLPVAL